jgi:hypothetical protein
MIRGCFVDNADLPIVCSHDINEPWNCTIASSGISKKDCPYWEPIRAIKLARDILGATEIDKRLDNRRTNESSKFS